VPTDTLSPGDELVLTVTFLNTTQHALDGLRITQPIPPTMRYVEGSAIGPGSEVLYSVDDGATYGLPRELNVVAADGVRRSATVADYTQVRWLIKAPLEAGARAFVRFRASVRFAPETPAPAPAAATTAPPSATTAPPSATAAPPAATSPAPAAPQTPAASRARE
jgi:uncharacterized repeat protein (TIGR01451 family)